MDDYCCKKFAQHAGAMQSISPAAGAYPPEMRSSAQFEQDNDGAWNINGCCGGGCYVVSEMRFCPFCGAGVTESPAIDKAGGE